MQGTGRASQAADIATQPGYVRLVLPPRDPQARAACRRFSDLCREEGANCGLIVARFSGSGPVELESHIALAMREVSPRFRLGFVAQGTGASCIGRIAASLTHRRGAEVRVFPSEHRAAAWLMSAEQA